MSGIAVHKHVSLAPYTTLKVGGPAEYFVEVRSMDALSGAVEWAEEHGVEITVLGGGSNVLVSDRGIKGLVIRNMIDAFAVEEREDKTVRVIVGAGVHFDGLVGETVVRGWWGLENLSAIPGRVGAVPIQNVGAYGVEAKDLIEWVEVYDTQTNEVRTMMNHECMFAYRDSFFKTMEGRNLIVTRVAFVLSRTPQPQLTYRDLSEWFIEKEESPSLAAIRAAVMSIRTHKFPDWHEVGTAGSFFKNPILTQETFDALKSKYPELPGFQTDHGDVKVPLGWILDHILGLRGESDGSVGTYKEQALVIVNNGGATTEDIVRYAEYVAERVRTEVGIEVEWEVTRLGIDH